jgi:hypothetical protein
MPTEVSLAAHRAAPNSIFKSPEFPASLRPITYREVFKHVEDELSERLETKGKSQKRVGNFRTARNGWLTECGLSEESPVGVEFGSGFNGSLERYLTTLTREGKSAQTLADRRSMIGVYREAWVSLLQSAAAAGVLEGDFAQALNRLVKSSGVSVGVITRNAAVNETTFNAWRNGKRWPSRLLLPAVHRLEGVFGLPLGVLAAKLPQMLSGGTGSIRTGLTGYRKQLVKMRQLQYLLKEFLPALQSEWGDLFLFYTDAAWLRTRGLKRNSKWRVREHDGCCPTAEHARTQISEFMGYLCLPTNSENPHLRGKGCPREQLTLALLSDSDLIYNFLQFKRERTYLRHYNTGTYTFLSFCSSLLRPETGFLWQSPELGARLPVPVPAADWHEWCERHRSVILSTRKDLLQEDEFKKTRDPFEPIRAIILNNQHPLDVLFGLADAYEADAPPRHASPCRRAAHYQNLFLIKFATLIPLRVFNFSVMTWRPDGTGNLYQKPDGSWWVRFDSSYLKNHKGAAKDRPFDVPLHPTLWHYVEEFLFTHRPHLLRAAACEYVFRHGVMREANQARGAGRPVGRSNLSLQVFRITQRYIPHCPGFGIHAFRHLVATEYIKNNPAGYAVAAAVLNDKEETVRKSYAWVLPADKFGFWNDYVSALLGARGEADHE